MGVNEESQKSLLILEKSALNEEFNCTVLFRTVVRISSWLRSGNNNNANNANSVNSGGSNNNYNVSDLRAVRPALHSLTEEESKYSRIRKI